MTPRPWPIVDPPPGIALESGSVRGTVLVASRREGLAFAAFMFGLAAMLVAGLTGVIVRQVIRTVELGLWELRAVLRHYLEHPEHRGELGTPASLERIEELRREQTVPGWKPDWLPAPRV